MSAMPEATLDREIAFSAADFERVRSMIHAKAGIDLNTGKQNMVYSRLSRRLRECGHTSFRSYLDGLKGESDPEWQEFINCLTTNLTSFYREAHHFPVLAAHLNANAGAAPSGATQRIWCCAASTGEEPYTLAITVLETLGNSARVTIDASDIDTRVLATADAGMYSLDAASGVGEARLKRFFMRGTGVNEGKVRVKPELRALVNFRSFNLLSGAWTMQPYDVIFCRNVMIYFDRPTQRRVLERMHRVMKPGGLLVVGHSENFSEHRDLFQLIGKTA
ncbi:MAG: methyltransferase domain-containing protein, partial [Burkholderiaceae bacterium]|nr:methyltransferase domain-containing protein [Burkholderiaceae bacterium]